MDNYLDQLIVREPSPLVALKRQEYAERNLNVYVKQDYLLHPVFGGNKWRKLKYNLKHYLASNYESLWTFGGAYSNHIYAVAGVCKALDIPCHGIIRDTLESGQASATLEFARANGMQLHFASRQAYRNKPALLKKFTSGYANCYSIPEGGSNTLALEGVGELVSEVEAQLGRPTEYWVCAAGSGGTAAGLLKQMRAKQQLLVFPALQGNWMRSEILKLLPEASESRALKIIDGYHFGGYARYKSELVAFMKDWYAETGIPLDPIYNGKSFYGFEQKVKQDYFPEGSTIVLIHSGGLQGIPSYNSRNALQLPEK